ncbi:MAG: hypothetical protein QNJ65_16895 [Xenococcaceae cyanobacterium MO_234.B1]|nr:hypothetical protein [Xenococcaceae cyanobacterium MO_234.B1]
MSQFKQRQGTTAIGINLNRHFLKGSYSSGQNTRFAVQETSQAPERSQGTTAIGINLNRHFLKGSYSSSQNTCFAVQGTSQAPVYQQSIK